MINNEEFDFFDNSSENSEHANIPRVLILHKAPNDLTSPKNKVLTQSLKLPNKNKLKNRLIKNKEKNEDNKITKNKNNVIKSSFFNNNKNSYSNDKNKNNIGIKGIIIDLDGKLPKENSFTHTKTLIYQKVILKQNHNVINNKKESIRSPLLNKHKTILNKEKNINKEKMREIHLSISENNKMKKNTSEEKKIKSLKNSVLNSNNKKMNVNKKIIKKKKIGIQSRNNSNIKINSPTISESSLKFNKTHLIYNYADKCKNIIEFSETKILTKNLKNNRVKKINSSKDLTSIFSTFFNQKPKLKKSKNNITNNNALRSKKTMSKINNSNNKKNIMNKKPMRISLPLVHKKESKNIKNNEIKNKKNSNNNINKENKENDNSIRKSKSKTNKKINDKNKEGDINVSNFSINKTKTKKEVINNNIKDKNVILKSPNKVVLLKEEKKYYIKSHYVLTKSGKDELGQLKINQDSYLLLKGLNGLNDFNIFGVLDGHGPEGHFVSQFVSRYIQLEFQTNKSINKLKDTKLIYEKLSSDKFQMIKDIFLSADIKLRDQEIESRNSGTTCVIVIQVGEHIICANVGDSRAVLIYDKNKDNNYQVFRLSNDDKPDLKEEKERIIKMGGIVEKLSNQYGREIGPWRVWAKNKEYPGLAMSRSIGDFNGKNIGIISEPKIIETDFSININYIVICSDGVWEFLNNEEIMKLGNKYYEENNPNGFCKEVVDYSTKCWLEEDPIVDDITILTIFF